jgi:ATP-dependent exoDNAse (exonuclease V) beta subunit
MLTYNQCKEFKNIDKPNGRVYETPVGLYPSVTTVLKATADMRGIDAWRARVGEEEANMILEAASLRGSKLHKYLEDFLTECSNPTIEDARHFVACSGLNEEPDFIQQMVKSTLKHLVAHEYESIAQEFVVWDDDLKLAGRCDNLGYWLGTLTLVDFKTARKEKPLAYIKDYFLQATAYCKAHNRMFPTQVNRFVILIANEQGGFQLFTGTPNKYIPDLRYRVRKFYEQKTNKTD